MRGKRDAIAIAERVDRRFHRRGHEEEMRGVEEVQRAEREYICEGGDMREHIYM